MSNALYHRISDGWAAAIASSRMRRISAVVGQPGAGQGPLFGYSDQSNA